ncbi:MAG TPA: DUF1501 domain-containing protein [Planctomycetaceae bacterium]
MNSVVPKYAACVRQTFASRREFLSQSGLGLGAIALSQLLAGSTHGAPPGSTVPGAAADPLTPRPPHIAGKARNVILLFMQGGASHVDTFDPKPELARFDGQALPPSFKSDDLFLQFMKASDGKLMASPFPFKKYGASGLEISDLFQNVARHADDLAVIRSCYHDSFIHGPALSLLHSGSVLLGHPSVGSWVVYGLGCESRNLPAYMVMTDGNLRISSSGYNSGFLPAVYQGTFLGGEGAAIQNLAPPASVSAAQQRMLLDQLQAWNARHARERPADSRLDARIANYELAFRMQSAAPELIRISDEPAHVRELYGVDKEPTAKFGRMCLLARRMVERGVRFVQLYSSDWDGHGDCPGNHQANAAKIDRPIAGLIADLKQRGLLDETLIVWTGEFGRTPIMQGNKGRDHSPYGFSTWMAGGGIRGGKVVGATDDLGFRAVDDKVHVHDLHATMLSLLGLKHEELTYLFEGRRRRLTDVGGENDLAEVLVS